MKINLNTDLDIHAFSGSGVTEYDSGMTNVVIHKKGDKFRGTQRPSIDISEAAADLTVNTMNDRGRGIYYWENNSKLYIVHDNDVYATSQDTAPLTSAISAGTERVTILEAIGTPLLIFLDAENDEGWTMVVGETISAIGSNFPPTLCHGGAILDTYLFVMDEDGKIYNSAVNDPTTFPATGFITTERENDKGVYLGKHHDHLVAFGTRTIEFFYDAGNSVGSPLNRRQDISYNVGCADGLSVWENGDITYFIGSNPSGQLSLYKLEGFKVSPISNDTFDSYITQGLTQESLRVVINGLSAMGNPTLLMTIYTLTGASPGAIVPKLTISYDTATNAWGFWNTAIESHTTFPLMAWTKRTGGQNATVSARTGEGILYNGDIISINDKLIPIDTKLGTEGIYVAGIYEPDIYIASTSANGVNIPVIVRTGQQDFGTSAYKFQGRERVEMENTADSQTLTIKHSDEAVSTFDSGNTIDTSLDRKEVYQGGRFTKRNYQLEYSGDEQIFLEALDVDVSAGL
jgi:hypothetical protein